MTDNDIRGAMYYCRDFDSCNINCPFFNKGLDCASIISKYALDLINRQRIKSNKYRNRVQSQKGEITRLHKKVAEQKAELEEQKAEIERLRNSTKDIFMKATTHMDNIGDKIKSEAIKEFAEQLRKRFYLINGHCVVDIAQINNLVKEMTEVSE